MWIRVDLDPKRCFSICVTSFAGVDERVRATCD